MATAPPAGFRWSATGYTTRKGQYHRWLLCNRCDASCRSAGGHNRQRHPGR